MKNIFLIILTLFFAISSCKNKATEAKAEPATKDTAVSKKEIKGIKNEIDLSNLERGFYFIRVYLENMKTTIKKIIKN